MRVFSSKDLASHFGVSYIEAHGFVSFLKIKGIIVVAGKRKLDPNKRGKAETLYSFNEGAEASLTDLVQGVMSKEK